MGSNPISAIQSGVVQRQDVALLRQLSGFESLRRSHSYTCRMTTGIKAQPDFSRDTVLWLACLLEGEGSFMAGPPSHPNSPIIAVQATDEDVVAKVAQVFGVSHVPCAIRAAQWRRTYHARLRGESGGEADAGAAAFHGEAPAGANRPGASFLEASSPQGASGSKADGILIHNDR
jgi:hypothetical protein